MSKKGIRKGLIWQDQVPYFRPIGGDLGTVLVYTVLILKKSS